MTLNLDLNKNCLFSHLGVSNIKQLIRSTIILTSRHCNTAVSSLIDLNFKKGSRVLICFFNICSIPNVSFNIKNSQQYYEKYGITTS